MNIKVSMWWRKKSDYHASAKSKQVCHIILKQSQQSNLEVIVL